VDSAPTPAQADKPPILVSACLLGVACTHRAESKTNEAVRRLAGAGRVIPICPEVAGGLPIPRPAAELSPDGRVRTASGDDVTEYYERGAAQAVELARKENVTQAVLKARSPSCGSREIYDGSHSGALVEGEGVTAGALRRAGVEVISEEDL
jgi:purine-nucleoside phosphorylase